jgi:hypothetical protein
MFIRFQVNSLFRMNTRSKTLKLNINFDEASELWRANKKHIGNGHFKYKCLQKTQSGNDCKREALAGIDACKCHSKKVI